MRASISQCSNSLFHQALKYRVRPWAYWLLGAVIACLLVANPVHAQTVYTKQGVFFGSTKFSRSGSVYQYLGVPYAAPPTGLRRFLPPSPIQQDLQRRYFVTKQPPPCIQKSLLGEIVGSEDCLYLNIWKPAGRSGSLPVMVFIHGGANAFGGIADDIAQGDVLSRHGNVVVVSIQYRLGIFGFLANKRISEESGQLGVGNFAILDQIAALRWVQEHIAAFGGDPGNVTIFGESAGATAVNVLRSSPPAGPLFHRAIGQSAPQGVHSLAEALELGEADVNRLCSRRIKVAGSVLRCLQSLSADVLLGSARQAVHVDQKSIVDMGYRAVVDHHVLVDDETHLLDKPYLVGTNLLEAEAFIPLALKFAEVETALRNLFGDELDFLLKRSSIAAYDRAVKKLATDVSYGCHAERLATRSAKAGAPTFRYHYQHHAETVFGFSIPPFHATELPLLFGKLDPILNTQANREVSRFLMTAWTNFANTGDPNRGPNRLHAVWPRDDASQMKVLVVGGSGTRFQSKVGSIAEACKFLH